MHVLVLGGTGFVGSRLTAELAATGHNVTVFHRSLDPRGPDGIRHIRGDLDNLPDHLDQLCAQAPDVVVDMIPMRQEHGRRVRAFKGVAPYGVVISSIDVYKQFAFLHRSADEPGPRPEQAPSTGIDELAPLRTLPIEPAGIYHPLDYNKTGVELEARGDPDFPVTVLRLPGVYGSGDPYNRLYDYVKRMDDGRPAILLETRQAQWIWSYSHVINAAHAIAMCAVNERAAGRTYNVAEPFVTTRNWVREIAEVHGWNGEVVELPADRLPEHLRPSFDPSVTYPIDSSRIRAELGYSEIIGRPEAMEETIAAARLSPPSDMVRTNPDYAAEDAALNARSESARGS